MRNAGHRLIRIAQIAYGQITTRFVQDLAEGMSLAAEFSLQSSYRDADAVRDIFCADGTACDQKRNSAPDRLGYGIVPANSGHEAKQSTCVNDEFGVSEFVGRIQTLRGARDTVERTVEF